MDQWKLDWKRRFMYTMELELASHHAVKLLTTAMGRGPNNYLRQTVDISPPIARKYSKLRSS